MTYTKKDSRLSLDEAEELVKILKSMKYVAVIEKYHMGDTYMGWRGRVIVEEKGK